MDFRKQIKSSCPWFDVGDVSVTFLTELTYGGDHLVVDQSGRPRDSAVIVSVLELMVSFPDVIREVHNHYHGTLVGLFNDDVCFIF